MKDQSNSLAVNYQNQNSQFGQFIQSNQVYLQQKFHQHFDRSKEKNHQKHELTSLPIGTLLFYIFDIFSLQKYFKDIKTYNAISKSVQQNVKQYLMELDSDKLTQQNQLTFKRLMQILFFIVERNAMFSIQYEKKQINEPKQSIDQSNKNQIKFQVNIKIDQNVQGNEELNSKKSSQNNNIKKLNSFFMQNQFEYQINQEKMNSQICSQKLIKKNAKALFDFYCRQQMQLGGVITFDRLNEETSSMSLGKCLTFAKATNLYNKLIKRDDLVTKFKRLSEGKKYINLDKFQIMIAQFQLMDPNFNLRIGLLSQDIRKVLKYVKLPFNTKDVQPRQKIAVRNFSSKLTEHSGQTSQELKAQLDEKKQEMINLKKLNQIKDYLQWKQNRSQLIKQNDLKSSRLPKKRDLTVQLSFIGSIIHPEQEDQTYLKDHLILKLEKQTEKVPKFGNVFETERYKSLDKLTLRKQSVVSDIRKRIKEIESTENLSFSLQMKRSLSRNPSPNKRYTQI